MKTIRRFLRFWTDPRQVVGHDVGRLDRPATEARDHWPMLPPPRRTS